MKLLADPKQTSIYLPALFIAAVFLFVYQSGVCFLQAFWAIKIHGYEKVYGFAISFFCGSNDKQLWYSFSFGK